MVVGVGDAFRSGTHKAMIRAWLRIEGRLDELALRLCLDDTAHRGARSGACMLPRELDQAPTRQKRRERQGLRSRPSFLDFDERPKCHGTTHYTEQINSGKRCA